MIPAGSEKRPPSALRGVVAAVLIVGAGVVAVPAWRRWSEPESAPPQAVALPAVTTAPLVTFVQAPASSQLSDQRPGAPTAGAPLAPPAPPSPGPAAPAVPQAAAQLPAAQERLELQRLTADELHQRLQKAFGREFPPLANDGTPWLRFSVDTGDGNPILLAANRDTRQVSLVGRPAQLRAWRQIIAALDAPEAADKVTQVLAADKAAAPQVRQAVTVLLAQAQQPAGGAAAAPPGGVRVEEAPAGNDQGLLGPVQIEVVEGTDLFVIRGNPRDVERVMEVIRQIEAMSRVSEPKVVVYQLKHVDSQAMTTVLGQVFAAHGSGRRFHPHALLRSASVRAAGPTQRGAADRRPQHRRQGHRNSRPAR